LFVPLKRRAADWRTTRSPPPTPSPSSPAATAVWSAGAVAGCQVTPRRRRHRLRQAQPQRPTSAGPGDDDQPALGLRGHDRRNALVQRSPFVSAPRPGEAGAATGVPDVDGHRHPARAPRGASCRCPSRAAGAVHCCTNPGSSIRANDTRAPPTCCRAGPGRCRRRLPTGSAARRPSDRAVSTAQVSRCRALLRLYVDLVDARSPGRPSPP
jgi:hypothetical protein